MAALGTFHSLSPELWIGLEKNLGRMEISNRNTELLDLCQILWIIGIVNISNIFIKIMTWIESLFAYSA